MGLDQYAWALDKRPEKDVDFELPEIGDDALIRTEEGPGKYGFAPDPVFGSLFNLKPECGMQALAYWRKHPDLHGFLREIYRRKGGTGWHWDEFSGPLLLDAADLDELETAVLAEKLPTTSGFFFGQSSLEDQKLDIEFIKRARAAIAAGKAVVYDSSW